MKSPDRRGSESSGSWLLEGRRADPDPPPPAESQLAEDLRICPSCSSSLVYPLEWAPVGACTWRVELRCPECEWTEAAVHEQHALDRFDQALDAATDSLIDDLRGLQRSNMEYELERFTAALGADLILPEDF